MTAAKVFSGSYDSADVTLLLNPVGEEAAARLYVDPAAKERLIQQGQRHYSEMISPERPPSAAYMDIFNTAMDRHAARMGREVATLVMALAERVDGPLTLCSLVRAGLPLGVLLQRGLKVLGRDSYHCGISIIRDRGIDAIALGQILDCRPAQGVVFVDGWTGKGAIAGELERTLLSWTDLPPRLVVLADPAGRAWLAAGYDDWLIPSGILGSTVSGLISRSILNDHVAPAGTLHAAIDLKALAPFDVSRQFVDTIETQMLAALRHGPPSLCEPDGELRARSSAVIDAVARRYDIANRNRIKPGIAEATRAVLRRAPELVLVAAGSDPDLDGLRYLAHQAQIAIETPEMPISPYRAITVIKNSE